MYPDAGRNSRQAWRGQPGTVRLVGDRNGPCLRLQWQIAPSHFASQNSLPIDARTIVLTT